MKKKTLLSLAVATGMALVVTSSMADIKLKDILSPFGNSGQAIYTVKIITPNGAEIKLDEVKASKGASCGALKTVVDFHSTANNAALADTETDTVNSGTLLFLLGANVGCIKVDATYKGKTYTSGPVALTWNASSYQYTAATPSSGTIDFSS